ncbi:hypothetical protein J9317_05115 [Metabacillus sp. KIGAM252]|uniref:DUF5678 domain-containing protein n=2 Tax=Metabacillus flavus TaxID=2823519 RepID=A0ABS5LBN9_9BACI|nr:hypothetical protein [Metabacillus flavus]
MEADFSADPIWCSKCEENLDIDNFPLSEELKEELAEWIGDYGEWIDMEKDTLMPGGLELEGKHDERGLELFNKVKASLGEGFPIVFVPSPLGQWYKK